MILAKPYRKVRC